MKKNRWIKVLSLSLAAVLSCAFFTGCDFVGIEPLLGLLPGMDRHQTPMRVTMDYGNYRGSGYATPLLESCETDFLDKQQWGLDEFVPGDVYYVTYTGEMMFLESYPGRVVLKDGAVVSVERKNAGILAVSFDEQQVLQSLEDDFVLDAQLPEYVILNRDGDFCKTEHCFYGGTLYATYEKAKAEQTEDGKMLITVLAIYAYMPR